MRTVLAIIVVAWLAGSTKSADEPMPRFARSEIHMGVEFEVVLYAVEPGQANAALAKAMARVADLDKKLSDYDPDSELSKLSETSTVAAEPAPAVFPTVKLSDDLWNVLSLSQQLSQASGGAFDVTIGPLTKLWRRARRWKELPDADALAVARASVGYQLLELDATSHTARLRKANMRLDLGGIAKGYAAAEAVKSVVALGIPRVLVRASGDIVAFDPPPGERGWRIGVAPLNPDDPPTRFIELAQGGVSTSGDARQHLIINGRRYSHIIDPRSGDPVSGRSSVTVVAPSGMLADVLATAASVLGPEKVLQLMGKFPGTELLMVYEDDNGQRRTVESKGFRRFEAP